MKKLTEKLTKSCLNMLNADQNLVSVNLRAVDFTARSGGGGGNRTRVRKPYTVSTTCVARSFDLAAHPPTGRLMRSESPKFDAVQSDPAQHETPSMTLDRKS